jgi:periplasmic divalent cation tolerance protein
MNDFNTYIFFVTVPTEDEAIKLAHHIVEQKLAACTNIIKNISSIYRWKGKIEEDNEFLMMIKTTQNNNEKLIQEIEKMHSYETPECVGFKIEMGSEKYLKWLTNAVK